MDPTTFLVLAAACCPNVHPSTARALVEVESGFNIHAIGVVGGALDRQPRNRAEAISTVRALEAAGWIYSAGLGQINSRNLTRLGLGPTSVFEPCANLQAMQAILSECLERSRGSPQIALRRALSCYYSGNAEAGFRQGYVARVVASALRQSTNQYPQEGSP